MRKLLIYAGIRKVFRTVLICTLFCGISSLYAQPANSISFRQALGQKADWYNSAEALRIADNVLLYQHNNGGWEKNIDMAKPLNSEGKARLLKRKSEAGTGIDNGATYTQMRYLQRVYQATGLEKYREAFLKGVDFLLEAQYDNGGWPQFYPVPKGYYGHITYNDGAMIGAMSVLRDIAEQKPGYGFVDPGRRKQAARAIEKGLEVILKTQIEVDGKLTAWCAQHDKETFKPAKARAYELPSISGGESSGIVNYLMEIENPSAEVKRAIEAAVAWFDQVKIEGKKIVRKQSDKQPEGFDLVLTDDPSAPPMWARFYEIGTNRPIFVGRNGIVHYNYSEIELERRAGYAYLTDNPASLLEKAYPQWKRKN